MRVPRQRVFLFIVNGKNSWVEDAAGRTAPETQHKMALHTGDFVRVIEQYLEGAQTREAEAEEDND